MTATQGDTEFQRAQRRADESHAAWREKAAALPQTGPVTAEHLPPADAYTSAAAAKQAGAVVRRFVANPKFTPDGKGGVYGYVVELHPNPESGKTGYSVGAYPYTAAGEPNPARGMRPAGHQTPSGMPDATVDAAKAVDGFNELLAKLLPHGEERPAADLDAFVAAKKGAK